MPPGRVAPNGGTRTQGGAAQIGSERAWQRRAGCERADCDTNNAASLKEARVDHSEGGVCVTSIQGGVQRRNLFLLQYDVSAGLKHKTARSEEAPSRNCVCGLTNTEGQKWGSMRVMEVLAAKTGPGKSRVFVTKKCKSFLETRKPITG